MRFAFNFKVLKFLTKIFLKNRDNRDKMLLYSLLAFDLNLTQASYFLNERADVTNVRN